MRPLWIASTERSVSGARDGAAARSTGSCRCLGRFHDADFLVAQAVKRVHQRVDLALNQRLVEPEVARRVRAIACMRRTSASLRGSGLICPIRARLSSAARLKDVSYQWQDGLCEHAVDEGVSLGATTLELRRSVAGGIDFAAELGFQRDQ